MISASSALRPIALASGATPMLAVIGRARPPGPRAARSRRTVSSSELGEPLGLGAPAGRRQDRELVAAEARERVALAQAGRQRARDPHDQLVAGAVAEGVVDLLEVVQVDHQHGALVAVALAALQVLLQAPLVGAAVEQAR